MHSMRYYVSSHAGQWLVKYGKIACSFPSQADAIHAAIETARDFGDDFHGAEVLLEGEDGQARTIWTYGEEPERKFG